MLLMSLSVPITAVAAETDIVSIRYDSVSETDDGNFIFSFTETDKSFTRNTTHEKKTSMLVVPSNKEYYDEIKAEIEKNQSARYDASYYDTAVDTSRSYTIFATVYYDKVTAVNGQLYIKVSSVSGGFYGASGTTGNYVGSGVYIESQALEIQSSGNPLGGTDTNYIMQKENLEFTGTQRSWSCATPSDWIPVYQYSMGDAKLGIILSVTARRGTSGSGSLCTALLEIEYPST